jgi:hypothetical protein
VAFWFLFVIVLIISCHFPLRFWKGKGHQGEVWHVNWVVLYSTVLGVEQQHFCQRKNISGLHLVAVVVWVPGVFFSGCKVRRD